MSRRRFFLVLLAVVAVCALGRSGIVSAQGRSGEAFERVRRVQEAHTERLMAQAGVVGTAVGAGDAGHYAVLVFLERPGVPGIPDELGGVRVRPVFTGQFEALPKPPSPPGQAKKPPSGDETAPAAPMLLTAEAISGSQIELDWENNEEEDLSYYRVYRATISGGEYSQVASGVESSAHTDGGLSPETTYYYVVTAVDTSGNESTHSEEAFATTLETAVSPYRRPAPIGVSTGHPNITAGTIGCRVAKNGQVYALSNNHVYADENRAQTGDNVLQPGPYDGGQDPRDAIGTLDDYEPIVFSRRADNVIDAAIALSSTDMLDKATPSYGAPSSSPAAAEIDLAVKKHGRTTGLTFGEIYALNATVNIRYDSGFARFIGQMVITPGTFSEGGDSGSLIVTQDGKNPVGLLFAGSRSYTIANPIAAVLDRFGVTIDGQ